ncbi:bacterial TniB family protein [Mycobacteroides abscessus MAB_110811_1470]|nr:bacterial TniB family protein [Mycobacteroides abscessus MAB_110811_1470]
MSYPGRSLSCDDRRGTYLYDRTGGSIGSLRALLNDAAIAAIISGEELVSRKLLDMTSTDFAAEEAATWTVAEEKSTPMPLKRAE